jgi:solute carrier family 25 S-adenosylmethionine transporter 26
MRRSAAQRPTRRLRTHPAAKVPLFMLASAAESSSGGSPPSWANTAANLAAGATAGCAVEAALYPIDTIKTRLQAMIGGGGLMALLASGGGKALYAGVWGNLAGAAPSSAIFMAFYEPVKQAVHKAVSEDKPYLGPVVAGARRRRACRSEAGVRPRGLRAR